jgi:hypothetical protein
MMKPLRISLLVKLSGWLLGGVLTILPGVAQANAIWPPAVYFHTLAVWWVIAASLILEFVLHLVFLRLSVLHLARIVIVSNLASALIGLLLTWPLVFWEDGVTRLAAMAPVSIFSVLFIIFALNVLVEYVIAIRWAQVKNSYSTFGSFFLANAASYGLIVWVALSGILSET